MLIAPPIFTQVSLPSSLTKPTPYAAQEFADDAPFIGKVLWNVLGKVLLDRAGSENVGALDDCAIAQDVANETVVTTRIQLRMVQRCILHRAKALPDKLDPGSISSAPDHLAGMAGARIAGKPQSHRRGQSVRALDHDLGACGGNILNHALASREAAFKRDPRRFPQLLPGFPFFDRCHFFPS